MIIETERSDGRLRHSGLWLRSSTEMASESFFKVAAPEPIHHRWAAFSMPRPGMPIIGWMRTANRLSSQSVSQNMKSRGWVCKPLHKILGVANLEIAGEGPH